MINQIDQMNLRDYFAAKAMAAFIAEPQWHDGESSFLDKVIAGATCNSAEEMFAIAAYRLADAMLVAGNPSQVATKDYGT